MLHGFLLGGLNIDPLRAALLPPQGQGELLLVVLLAPLAAGRQSVPEATARGHPGLA